MRTTTGLFTLVLVFLHAAQAPASSDRHCLLKPLTLELQRKADIVDVQVSNCSDFPVTTSLYLNAANLRSRAKNSRVVVTVPAGRTITAMQAHISDTRRPWKKPPFMDWTWGDLQARHDDKYRYRLPYPPGTSYRILQGYNGSFSHDGLERFTIDFDMPIGTPVHAMRNGVVVEVVKHNDKGCFRSGCGAHANYIVIMHTDGTTGEYYHLEKNGAVVEPGQRVRRGQHIGYSGNTGHTALRHLHFGVYRPVGWGRTESIPSFFQTGGRVERGLTQWQWYRVADRQENS